MENRKVSFLINKQIPDFIRSENPKFISFIEKYYEWLEQNGNVLSETNNLFDSFDIDTANETYLQYLRDDLMPYFPENMAANKKLFLKLIKHFYNSKGTLESLKFAFRAFYNDDSDVYFPKQDILKVSDGKWVLPLALRIDTTDDNIFNLEKIKITGENSKATAFVEKVIKSVDRQLGIEYVEIYISNIERLFETGENIYGIFYNNVGNPVTVTGRIVGALSELKIDSNNRGLYYNGYDATTGYEGDPVTIVGGLNSSSGSPIGARATVGETTKGSVTNIYVLNGGFGFRETSQYPGASEIDFYGGYSSSSSINNIHETRAEISLLDKQIYRTLNVSSTVIDEFDEQLISQIDPYSNTIITTLSTYQSLNVHPISFVTITGQGGGYKEKPTAEVYSFYNESTGESIIGTSGSPIIFSVNADNYEYVSSNSSPSLKTTYGLEKDDLIRIIDNASRINEIKKISSVTESTITFTEKSPISISGLRAYKILKRDLRVLGSLGRISIHDGGSNYAIGDNLIFTGGSGYGANGTVTGIHSANAGIKTVDIVEHSSNVYIRGGEGYSMNSLPSIFVSSANGSGADLIVTEILGDGEILDLSTSKIGAISTIRVSSYGYDYVDSPYISLRNIDLQVSNVTQGKLFVSNTKVYQGISNTNFTFSAYVDEYNDSTGLLRLFNYSGNLSNTSLLMSDDNIVSGNVYSYSIYGDGKAKASAKFENGLIRLPGIYLNTDGHISSDKFIQDDDMYHNYSYIVETQHDYKDFKTAFNEVFHPVGTKVFVRKSTNIEDQLTSNVNSTITIVNTIDTTFNVSSGSNTVICTNNSFNLTQSINVGDTIVFTNMYKTISGLANVTSSSNVVSGNGTNFINDVREDDTIVISGSNLSISSIESSNVMIMEDNFVSTSNNLIIQIMYNEFKKVSFVNANTIIVDSNVKSNSLYVPAILYKTV